MKRIPVILLALITFGAIVFSLLRPNDPDNRKIALVSIKTIPRQRITCELVMNTGLSAAQQDVVETNNVNATNTVPGMARKEESKQAGGAKIPNERIMSFYSESDRDAFIATAEADGIVILDTLNLGNSVRIRFESKEQLDGVLRKSPTPVEQGDNYYVRFPDRPRDREKSTPESGYLGFGSHALDWLGVGSENKSWGSGITIAVLDTEIMPHAALDENKIIKVDFGKMEENTATVEYNGHGTAVASLLIGNGNGVSGIAPDSRILGIPVMSGAGQGDAFTLARGIVEAVDRGANIISLSLGCDSDSFILKEAVDYAAAKNVAIIASAGNDGIEGVSYPAQYDSVVAVSAVDAADRHLFFANRGDAVDIAGPGIGINAAWSEDKIVGFSGTSASVPFVSGATAWLMSQNPGMTAETAVEILKEYSDDSGAPGEDDELGSGILDIRRVMDREKPGIYDAAACNPYIDHPENEQDDFNVTAYAQNRGTERLDLLDLRINTGNESRTLTYYNIEPGEVVSHEFQVSVSRIQQFGPMRITCSVATPGVIDAYPANNSSKAALLVYEGGNQ